MQYLPLFFDLKGRDVLLVGGGDIALRKARLLSRAGAQLSVVALDILPELHELLDQHQGLAITGPYHAPLLAGKPWCWLQRMMKC